MKKRYVTHAESMANIITRLHAERDVARAERDAALAKLDAAADGLRPIWSSNNLDPGASYINHNIST